ncbi:hypothetical protein FN976_13390 [Caenimonas sedimenti]|uniref:Uncharacterized protein n=1 Tax=Caenimonas sedimenti TaxID=2596921 RepID=A0A562ZQI7_9BURK|nr:hypothetical protein [Caenimonas sedimenti]TWO70555.1 hypothetical protein FN976_13390 [Caenimonas sedimenti]
MKLRLAALLVLSGAWCPGWAQPQLATNEVVFKSGNWFVVRSARARSDTVGCTGYYKSERDVQLGADQLILKVPGKPRQIVVRFNDEVSLPSRAATKAEQQLGAIVIGGDQFEKLQTSRRLNVEFSSKEKRSQVALRLQGLPEALANIRNGCPPAAKPAASSLCTEPLMARMRANGVTAAQVERICR